MDHERCEDCGFDGSTFDASGLLEALRVLGPAWEQVLDGAGGELRVRPATDVWSAIEYAGHSRDITALHVYAVDQALSLDEPVLMEIDADGLIDDAVAGYMDLNPDDVAHQIAAETGALADRATGVPVESWQRGITFGTERSDVRFLLEHALHDSTHHLVDVERGLLLLRADPS